MEIQPRFGPDVKMPDDTPIDFLSRWERKHGPDAQFVMREFDGTRWYTFTCSYTDNATGEVFGFHLWARDIDDAKRRLALMAKNGVVDGQLYSEWPA